MPAAILLPAAFVRLGAERLLLAVADRLDSAGAQAGLHQSVLYGVGTAVAQSQVVFRGAALVAVSFKRELDVGMLAKELRVALNGGLLVGTNTIRVVIKVDVAHVLREQFLFACRGRWGRWGRCGIYGDPSRCLLRSSGTFRDQVIGRRLGRSYLLRPVRLYGTDAVDADIRGQRGLPGQRRRHPLIDGVRVGRERGGRRRGWGRRWRRRWCLLLLAGT